MSTLRFSACLLVLLLIPFSAWAQAGLGLEIGYNDGIHSHLDSRDYVIDAQVRPIYSLGLFNGHFGEEGRTARWGLRYANQLVKTIPREGPGYASKWRSQIFQIETERLIVAGQGAQIVLGTGFGFVARSHSNENEGWNYCDSPFCNLPDFNWLVTPKARLLVPVIDGLALSAEVRANLHVSNASDTYPYKSGLAFMVGVEWRTEPGPGDPVREPVPEPADNPLY